jgi:hypothetical protein
MNINEETGNVEDYEIVDDLDWKRLIISILPLFFYLD